MSTAHANPAARTWSTYQDAVFSFFAQDTGSAVVEAVAGWLVDLGHEPRSIRTERFGS